MGDEVPEKGSAVQQAAKGKRKTWADMEVLLTDDFKLTRRKGITELYCKRSRNSIDSNGIRPIYDVLVALRAARELLGPERTAASITIAQLDPIRPEFCTEQIELWIPVINEMIVIHGVFNMYLLSLACWTGSTRKNVEGRRERLGRFAAICHPPWPPEVAIPPSTEIVPLSGAQELDLS